MPSMVAEVTPHAATPRLCVGRVELAPSRRVPVALPRRERLGFQPDLLIQAAKRNRWGHRDSIMVLVAWRHGLRVSELVDLRWDQIGFATATLHVRRVKQGTPSTHPIMGEVLRALRECSGSRIPRHHSCSPASGLVRSPRRDLPE